MAAATEPRPPIELGPRSALLFWGGGLLLIGLALVGAGAEDEGAALALAGLLNTIYGIHTFGRLGPDDAAEGPDGSRQQIAQVAVWTGALTLVAGLAVALDGHLVRHLAPGGWAVVTYGVMAVGALRIRQGFVARRPARVEKRRRLRKSAAP
jgi:tetrahydromethanopterin S-methyltransferase subunit C